MPAKRKATKHDSSTDSSSARKQAKTCHNPSNPTSGRPKRANASKKKTASVEKKAAVKRTTSKKAVAKKSESKTMAAKKSAMFTWFMKTYKGLSDWHIPIFREAASYTGAKYVLYPGSHTHITASLLFPSVVYVDFNAKVGPVFDDEVALDWVEKNKEYADESKVKFMCKNFDGTFEKVGSFDLMISASAGIVCTKCAKYLRIGGHFLVSDAHSDARMAYLDEHFELEGVFDKDTGKVNTDEDELKEHFHTVSGTCITKAQVEESVAKPKSKRSFKLKKEAMFYLFKKIK